MSYTYYNTNSVSVNLLFAANVTYYSPHNASAVESLLCSSGTLKITVCVAVLNGDFILSNLRSLRTGLPRVVHTPRPTCRLSTLTRL